ncbi:hypothetical protein [Candidatus Nucleicultrix amoebiphila]|uniref:Uncharacterized protein n=1 Tax=Candidatus Nucleicultrix amoebiphila FS5 TaxID=1414854 RepID=A0A1W6N5Q5_9PROT|nr:hypothetical protein [Candidatus Nucleicultrix amoebiphila]ARN85210.1 hypothetical protein GQ61_07845 [Candidatus Nucleicultrix amoebiphila FS5]
MKKHIILFVLSLVISPSVLKASDSSEEEKTYKIKEILDLEAFPSYQSFVSPAHYKGFNSRGQSIDLKSPRLTITYVDEDGQIIDKGKNNKLFPSSESATETFRTLETSVKHVCLGLTMHGCGIQPGIAPVTKRVSYITKPFVFSLPEPKKISNVMIVLHQNQQDDSLPPVYHVDVSLFTFDRGFIFPTRFWNFCSPSEATLITSTTGIDQAWESYFQGPVVPLQPLISLSAVDFPAILEQISNVHIPSHIQIAEIVDEDDMKYSFASSIPFGLTEKSQVRSTAPIILHPTPMNLKKIEFNVRVEGVLKSERHDYSYINSNTNGNLLVFDFPSQQTLTGFNVLQAILPQQDSEDVLTTHFRLLSIEGEALGTESIDFKIKNGQKAVTQDKDIFKD